HAFNWSTAAFTTSNICMRRRSPTRTSGRWTCARSPRSGRRASTFGVACASTLSTSFASSSAGLLGAIGEDMRLLVTGSPGWLSDAFLEAAARGGVAGLRYVRCLFHRSAMHAAAAYRQRFASSSLEVDTVEGDLTDRASLQSAVAGMDVVLHGAAIMHPKRPRDYFRVN